jgi:outer membrane protein TolC
LAELSFARQEASSRLVDDAREVVALNVIATYLEALRTKAARDTLMSRRNWLELYRVTRDHVTQGVAAELNPDRPVGGLLQMATTRFGKNRP